MQAIKSLLNQLKWDKKLDSSEFSFFYLDRISQKLIEIKYDNIKRIEDNIIVLERDGEETFIPLHRIKQVKKKGELVWKRQII